MSEFTYRVSYEHSLLTYSTVQNKNQIYSEHVNRDNRLNEQKQH